MVRGDRSAFSEMEQDTIRSAAAKILAHPIFRASERSTKLFRYLLDRALANDDEALKERRIGHEVFGRDIGYDTADDPIVRNAASDTRKRLRQYDADNGSGLPVHVLLRPGAYVLEFRFDEEVPKEDEDAALRPAVSAVTTIPPPVAIPTAAMLPPARTARLPWWLAAIAMIACLFFAGAFFWQRQQIRAAGVGVLSDNPLWNPMLRSGKEVFICLGHAETPTTGNPALDLASAGLQRITLTDLKAYTNISGFLQLNGQDFQMRTDNQTTLLDLRDRPTVLIGILNNQWTLRLTGNLRYHFDFSKSAAGNADRSVSIVDTEHPGQPGWQVRLGADADEDYAIAGRTLDPVTGGLVLYVAGAGRVGTQAASEFVTKTAFLKDLPVSLANPRTNIQVVLRTHIVGGIPGTPEVVATHVY